MINNQILFIKPLNGFSKILLVLLTLSISLLAQNLTLSGSVISDNEKMITSRFMGFVTDVKVSEGDHVKKGQLLYSIDSREIDSALSQVKLGISQAKLSLQMYQNQYINVKLNLDRNRRLLKKDMVSKFDVENLELAARSLMDMVEIAKKQVQQAEARLLEIQNQYQYLNVKAPNSGVVVSKNIKVGEMAMPGMPAIVLSDLSNLKILTEIPESNLNFIKYGTKVVVRIPSVNLEAIGEVTAIIPSSNPMTHTFKIKVSFKHSNFSVYPGMYATVDIGVN
jgi:RND family efflux transporter MFP subunit